MSFESFEKAPPLFRPFAIEACWMTSKWDKLDTQLSLTEDSQMIDFNIGIGSALLHLRNGDLVGLNNIMGKLRAETARGFSAANILSLQGCHDVLLKLQALSELEEIGELQGSDTLN